MILHCIWCSEKMMKKILSTAIFNQANWKKTIPKNINKCWKRMVQIFVELLWSIRICFTCFLLQINVIYLNVSNPSNIWCQLHNIENDNWGIQLYYWICEQSKKIQYKLHLLAPTRVALNRVYRVITTVFKVLFQTGCLCWQLY